jgi:flagellar protein FlaJ
MVASTFKWLILPLHVSMVGLLIFIPEVMKLFTKSIQESAESLSSSSSSNIPNSSVPIGEIFTFGDINLGLINVLVTLVVITLTISNAYAPKAADGGSNLKVFYNLALTMVLTGIIMLAVPVFAETLFESISEA